MLKAIRVQNFQSLKDVLLRLVPNGVNVITGPTDSGKSALFRALVFLFENRPQGWAFKSWFAGARAKTLVEVTTDLDDTVARVKSASKNLYVINGETEYAAVGSSVPDEARALLPTNVSNFQPQHKPYFMLQDTPGMVGEAFADVVGLNIISTVTTTAEAMVRNIRTHISEQERVVEDLENQVAQYALVGEMRAVFQYTSDVKQTLDNNASSMESLNGYLDSIRSISNSIDNVDSAINTLEPPLQEAIEALNKAVDTEKSRYLQQAIDRYHVLETAIDDLTAIISSVEPYYEVIWQLANDIETIQLGITRLHALIEAYRHERTSIDEAHEGIMQLERYIQDMIGLIGFCPLCGTVRGDNETTDHRRLAHTCRQP